MHACNANGSLNSLDVKSPRRPRSCGLFPGRLLGRGRELREHRAKDGQQTFHFSPESGSSVHLVPSGLGGPHATTTGAVGPDEGAPPGFAPAPSTSTLLGAPSSPNGSLGEPLSHTLPGPRTAPPRALGGASQQETPRGLVLFSTLRHPGSLSLPSPEGPACLGPGWLAPTAGTQRRQGGPRDAHEYGAGVPRRAGLRGLAPPSSVRPHTQGSQARWLPLAPCLRRPVVTLGRSGPGPLALVLPCPSAQTRSGHRGLIPV